MTEWPAGVGREVHATLDSTSAEALRRAASGVTGPLWLMAQEQTAGRGRRGRGWRGGRGNFAATLLMPVPGGPALAAQRSFVAALGLHDALGLVTGQPGAFGLKWPNDVLLGGRKLAGILLETAGGMPSGQVTLAVGIGVNLAQAPEAAMVEEGAVPPVSLAAASLPVPGPEAFLDCLAPALQVWEEILLRDGFGPVRQAWLARAMHLGGPVTARLPGREIAGVFEGIDGSGALLLRTETGRVTLPAADIHFPPVPADREVF